jgi:hypothetical protein
MLGTSQDRLWDQLIRQVQGLPKDSIVEIIDDSSRLEPVSDSNAQRPTVRRVVKWPVQRPRRAAW